MYSNGKAGGKRLWRLTPTRRSDFNVPTPIIVGEHLLVPWENNGTLLFRFKKDHGRAEAALIALWCERLQRGLAARRGA